MVRVNARFFVINARMTPSKDGSCAPCDDSSSLVPVNVCAFRQRLRRPETGLPFAAIEATGLGMPRFARLLPALVGSQVTDETGLAGAWDFHLDYADERLTPQSDAPPIFAALQDQPGLKLESHKGPVEVLVVDHAERPTAN